jgi:hypothetical protein
LHGDIERLSVDFHSARIFQFGTHQEVVVPMEKHDPYATLRSPPQGVEERSQSSLFKGRSPKPGTKNVSKQEQGIGALLPNMSNELASTLDPRRITPVQMKIRREPGPPRGAAPAGFPRAIGISDSGLSFRW